MTAFDGVFNAVFRTFLSENLLDTVWKCFETLIVHLWRFGIACGGNGKNRTFEICVVFINSSHSSNRALK